ncbi:alpha-(1,6)-fucosyltransferase-like isoform X1 [Clavelina lepadiformis]|uniref:alpha-(1,6)-fucosyltransferase-like isoform X1 n=2 Tax=Clavelina lepadiformis TaxID=159417 RepID=UPI00404332BB
MTFSTMYKTIQLKSIFNLLLLTIFIYVTVYVTNNEKRFETTMPILRSLPTKFEISNLKISPMSSYDETQYEQRLALLSDYRQVIKKIFVEARQVKRFTQALFQDAPTKRSELADDFSRHVVPFNDLIYNIKTLGDAIIKESEKELAQLGEIVQKQIHELQNPKNCKTARKLICDSGKTCGTGCSFHHFAYCLFVALGTNRTMIWGSTISNSLEGIKEVFLPLSETCQKVDEVAAVNWHSDRSSNPTPDNVPVIKVAAKLQDTSFKPFTIPVDLKEKVVKLHNDPNVWWIGQIMRYLFRGQPWVMEIVQDIKEKFQMKQPYASIHVRRTDKVSLHLAPAHELSDYMDHVTEWFNDYERFHARKVPRKVYIASDDQTVIEEAIAKFPSYEFAHYWLGKKHKSSTTTSRKSLDGLLAIVCDVILLSEGDYFVGTYSSNVGTLVKQLMDSRKDALFSAHSLDLDMRYGSLKAERSCKPLFEAIADHAPGDASEISLKTGDQIEYFPTKQDFSYKVFGKNRRTGESGLFPLHKTKQVLVTVPYPGYNFTLG